MPDYDFRFPETFLEVGKDDDYSYKSLRTTRLSDGRINVDVEGYGLKGHSLYLFVETGDAIKMSIRGRCAVGVRRDTWKRVSLSRVIEKEEESKAEFIEHFGYVPAPISVANIIIQLRLFKFGYPKS